MRPNRIIAGPELVYTAVRCHELSFAIGLLDLKLVRSVRKDQDTKGIQVTGLCCSGLEIPAGNVRYEEWRHDHTVRNINHRNCTLVRLDDTRESDCEMYREMVEMDDVNKMDEIIFVPNSCSI
jgi:hypothetical protein